MFIRRYLNGHGKGIDVYPYEGLGQKKLANDITQFPFKDGMFDSVTLIANLNHIPRSQRDVELREAYRCLKPGRNVIATMGLPLIEVLAHRMVELYDRMIGTQYDMDSIRGMDEEEAYYLTSVEIFDLLSAAGFQGVVRKPFWIQWGVNAMFIGWKPPASEKKKS